MDSNGKIIIIINQKMYKFKSSYKIVEYFTKQENINTTEGLTDEMIFVLQRPYMINRILKCIKGCEQKCLLKESTIIKYCNIPNFTMIRN